MIILKQNLNGLSCHCTTGKKIRMATGLWSLKSAKNKDQVISDLNFEEISNSIDFCSFFSNGNAYLESASSITSPYLILATGMSLCC